jgi:hypothetical protein
LAARSGKAGKVSITRRRISAPTAKIRTALSKAPLARAWKRASRFTAYSMALPWGMMA